MLLGTRHVYNGREWNRFDEYNTTTRAGHNLIEKISWTRTRGRLAIHPLLRVDSFRKILFPPRTAGIRRRVCAAAAGSFLLLSTARFGAGAD